MTSLNLINRARCAALLALSLSGMAHAATYTVTNSNDSGTGSLRWAITQANATSSNDQIVFNAGANGTITLASPLPNVVEAGGDLTITGNGAANTIIDGGGAYPIFRLPNAVNANSGIDLTVRRLTLSNGYADQGQGGAIYMMRASSLTVEEVEFDDNFATYDGGAIAVSNIAGTVSISNSLFIGNRSTTTGAALYAGNVTLSLRNSTLVSNIAPDSILQLAAATSRLVNITMVENQALRAIMTRDVGATTSLSNSLLANNTADSDLEAFAGGQYTVVTSRNNLIHKAGNSGIANGVNGNQVGLIPPLVGSLGNYGGPTRTLPLLPGSPAIDAGTTSGADIPSADQRGIARVGTPDIGAFESRGFVMTAVSGSGQSAQVSTVFTNPLIVEVAAAAPSEPVQGGQVTFTAPAPGASATLATPLALINGSGQAQTTVTANATVGGPYTVAASAVSGSPTPPSVDFSLSNTPAGNPVCVAFTFPYTLAGTDNTARVEELRQAIDCANANGSGDDDIDLDNQTLVFADGPYVDADGANALPILIHTITLQNGTLERDVSAAPFRFLKAGTSAPLHLGNMRLRNGHSLTDGGAILADYVFNAGMTRFENNRAEGHGGGLRLRDSGGGNFLTGVDFIGNAATHGAAISHNSVVTLLHSRIEDNGDASSLSVLHGGSGIGLVSILIANNLLPATGSVLLHYENPVTNRPELRNVTLANNSVQGPLFHSTVNLAIAYNTIVWGNQLASLGSVTPVNSIVQGVPNISVDPQFLNAGQRNYRLAATSPAIDAGDNAYGFPDFLDLDGDGITTENMPDLDLHPRPIDMPTVPDTGVGTAPIIDMGAFERQTGLCYDFVFPYTLAGADNTARVAELRQAIECANANATADVIDLAGFTLVIDDADVNDADNALPVITSAITLRDGTLERDTTAPNFRLLATSSGAHLIADSVNFRNGRAWEGGAIYNQGVLELQNAGFFDNGDLAQTLRGGAILNLGFTLRVLGSRFEGNRAESGGAVYLDTGDFFLRTSHLENNQATQGGALYALTGLARLLGNDFVENRANAGGAIHVDTFVLASGQRFLRNQATTHGGAVSGNDFLGQMWLSNSLFVGNLAPQGAVLHADNVRMSNVTISGHTDGAGSSLFSTPTPGTSAEVFNSIIWGNADTPVGVVTINRSVVEGGFPGGTDILDVDPRFTDAVNGDYRLMTHSPAIDAGSNDDVVSDSWMDIDEDGDFGEELDDLDGNPRRYDDTGVIDTGVGSAPVVDMGAFEKQTSSSVVLPTLSINDVSLDEGNAGTTDFSFTVSLSEPAPAGGVTFDIATANDTAVAPGDYTARSLISQTIAAGNSSYSFTVQVNGDTYVEPNETFFVNVSNVTGADVVDAQGTGTILNDDNAGITVNPTAGLVTTEAGGTATFTLVLTSQPAADVSIALSSSDDTEGTVTPTEVTFTVANWNQAQVVTVTGVADDEPDGDQPYTVVTEPAISADPNYDGVDAADVSVINEDVAVPRSLGGTVVGLAGTGLVLSLNGATEDLSVEENGRFVFDTLLTAGDAYEVAIATAPQAPTQSCAVINGIGTMGHTAISNVVINCGASTTFAIGGTVTGLAGTGLILQLNGGGDRTITTDGAYTFMPRLPDAASYIVTIAQQPVGQVCALNHASGTVSGVDVLDVDVACVPMAATLHLNVDDAGDYSRYGRVRDYFVTLANVGNGSASGVDVAASFSAAFDSPHIRWLCVASSGGTCTSQGAGGFADIADVPANSSVMWIISAPIRMASDEALATIEVDIDGGVAVATDTNTLVLLRDGFNMPYGDGANATDHAMPATLDEDRIVALTWPADMAEGLGTVLTVRVPDGRLDVQRLRVKGSEFVRLLVTHRSGQQRISAFAPVMPGDQLGLGYVSQGGSSGVVVLEGAERSLSLIVDLFESEGDGQ